MALTDTFIKNTKHSGEPAGDKCGHGIILTHANTHPNRAKWLI